MRKLRKRVDEIIAPHIRLEGIDYAPVKMALLVLAEAEAIEEQIGREKIGTERASELTGWSVATLQTYARLIVAGEEVPPAWLGMQVEKTPAGYAYQLGTIPPNPRSAAA